MGLKSIVCALSVVLIWGLNFSVIKFGLEELPPILFSGLRFLIVAIPAVFIVPFPKTSVWNVIGVGVFLGVLKFSFLFVAMKADASAGISSLLLQAQVIFTILFSALFFKEKTNRYQFAGIVMACLGFSLFIITSNGNITSNGLIMLLFAALFWAISNLIMKRTGDVNLLHFMVWVSLIPPIPLFILSFLFENRDPIGLLMATSEKSWLSVIYVGYISTLVAFAIWGWLLRSHHAATVTPFALLIPIVGIISSNLLLDETLTTLETFGTIFILLGLFTSVFGQRMFRFLTLNNRSAL
ncbi:EamA family transporter [Vibrio mangrovi]|uniref:EamA family transporter n=1 Tax=Vibrio mangrovi TaxID=474394 RepID=A0A1Y6IUB6_9VIBR|nr:EamA family transporter [Vibrio mangrovi]MDW6003003.1 EamA family transporter [Vibrio mangrovi]SMS01244.1 putative amino-acid metabolite efflux pump [Vibrio mangrovi]